MSTKKQREAWATVRDDVAIEDMTEEELNLLWDEINDMAAVALRKMRADKAKREKPPPLSWTGRERTMSEANPQGSPDFLGDK